VITQTLIIIISKSSSIILAFLNSLFILNTVDSHIRGYYFTFISVGAFSLMFELGIGTIIGQFLAHETGFFSVKRQIFTGHSENINRFFQIIRSTLIWYSKILSFGFLVLFTAGFLLFVSKSQQVSDWIIPWVIYLTALMLNVLLEIIFNALYTIGEVKNIQLVRLFSPIFAYSICWIGILVLPTGSLYFMVLVPVITFLVNLLFILAKFSTFIRQIFYIKDSDFSWNKEVLGLQKKMALSYLSGAFIYNIFTPAAFYFYGNDLAAKVGVTLQFANATSGVLNYVIGIQSLQLGRMFAQDDILATINFTKRLSLISFILSLGGMAALSAIYLLDVSKNFLPLSEALFFSAAALINTQVFIFASYIRAQKKEEFVGFSIIFAILTTIFIPISTYLNGSFGQSLTFLFVNLGFSLPFALIIFLKNLRTVQNKRIVL
jgi:hypothetical protein